MSRFLLTLLFFLIGTEHAYSGNSDLYISPGIRLGFDFRHKVTFGGKIGIGRSSDGGGPSFYGLTIGIRSAIFEPDSLKREYQSPFFEVQWGWQNNDLNKPLIYGGGIGGGLTRNKELFPRASLFCGFVFMGTADFTYTKKEKMDMEIGAEIFP